MEFGGKFSDWEFWKGFLNTETKEIFLTFELPERNLKGNLSVTLCILNADFKHFLRIGIRLIAKYISTLREFVLPFWRE